MEMGTLQWKRVDPPHGDGDEEEEDELEDSIFDEDSSAEKAEIEYRKSRRMLLEVENARNGMEEEDEDSSTQDESVVIKKGHVRDEENYSSTGLDLQFAPALTALPQSAEIHADADADEMDM